MNAQALRPSTIEALKALWVALPVRASNDGIEANPRERQMAILDSYCFALSEFSNDAIWAAVNNLRAGKIEEASKNFCPKAPELAGYVRTEQARIDAMNRPKAIPYKPKPSEFKDWRIVHRERASEMQRQGFVLHAKGIELTDFKAKGERRIFPAGTVFLWSIQEAWGPQEAAR